MTEQERQLIESLASRLRNSPSPEINPEAEDLIRRTIGTNPNALYILTQTVLLQEIALNQAKAKTPPPSFLGESAQAGDWGRDGRVQQGASLGGGYRGSSYQTGVPQAPPPIPQQSAWVVSGQPQSRMSSFLQGAAETAAGVVAGEMAFSALSSIFGHHGGGFLGGSGWGGGGWGGGGWSGGVSETIINNNYYEEAPQHHPEARNDDVSYTSGDDSYSDDADDSGGYDGDNDTLDV